MEMIDRESVEDGIIGICNGALAQFSGRPDLDEANNEILSQILALLHTMFTGEDSVPVRDEFNQKYRWTLKDGKLEIKDINPIRERLPDGTDVSKYYEDDDTTLKLELHYKDGKNTYTWKTPTAEGDE